MGTATTWHNGQLYSATDLPTLVDNRAFRLGDGLFETVRISGGQLLFYAQHHQRLLRGMQVLGLQWPAEYTADYVLAQMQALVAANSITGGGKLRLMVYRAGVAGSYLPSNNSAQTFAEASSILHNRYAIDRQLRLNVYRGHTVIYNDLSGLKTLSALPYIMAARHADKAGADDALLVDAQGSFVESAKANLFVVHHERLITPPLGSGCLAGIMRAQLLQLAAEKKIATSEEHITREMLQQADEVLLSNVVSGILPVSYIEGIGKSYASGPDTLTHRLHRALLQAASRHQP